MKNSFLLLLLFVFAKGFAQYPEDELIKQYNSDYNYKEFPILKDSAKKAGIYKTFEEFRNNNPSVTLQNKILPQEIKYKRGAFSDASYFTAYRLEISKEDAKQIGGVYGFCDGTKIYVGLNPEDSEKLNNPSFYEMEYIGKYCVYDAMYVSSLDNFSFNTPGPFIIDILTGDAQLLTTGKLKRIIADDKALLAEFKDSKGRKFEDLKAYLLRYLKTEKP